MIPSLKLAPRSTEAPDSSNSGGPPPTDGGCTSRRHRDPAEAPAPPPAVPAMKRLNFAGPPPADGADHEGPVVTSRREATNGHANGHGAPPPQTPRAAVQTPRASASGGPPMMMRLPVELAATRAGPGGQMDATHAPSSARRHPPMGAIAATAAALGGDNSTANGSTVSSANGLPADITAYIRDLGRPADVALDEDTERLIAGMADVSELREALRGAHRTIGGLEANFEAMHAHYHDRVAREVDRVTQWMSGQPGGAEAPGSGRRDRDCHGPSYHVSSPGSSANATPRRLASTHVPAHHANSQHGSANSLPTAAAHHEPLVVRLSQVNAETQTELTNLEVEAMLRYPNSVRPGGRTRSNGPALLSSLTAANRSPQRSINAAPKKISLSRASPSPAAHSPARTSVRPKPNLLGASTNSMQNTANSVRMSQTAVVATSRTTGRSSVTPGSTLLARLGTSQSNTLSRNNTATSGALRSSRPSSQNNSRPSSASQRPSTARSATPGTARLNTSRGKTTSEVPATARGRTPATTTPTARSLAEPMPARLSSSYMRVSRTGGVYKAADKNTLARHDSAIGGYVASLEATRRDSSGEDASATPRRGLLSSGGPQASPRALATSRAGTSYPPVTSRIAPE